MNSDKTPIPGTYGRAKGVFSELFEKWIPRDMENTEYYIVYNTANAVSKQRRLKATYDIYWLVM